MAKKTTKSKAVIFAGGVGTRMWPVSRVNFPKQFEKIIDNKSTIQLTVDHLRPEFSWENIFISTNSRYVKFIRKQLPKIPKENIIGEPVRRDVAPAVGYLMAILAKLGDQPTVILWSDHIRKEVDTFKQILRAGEKFIEKNPEKFLFVGQTPRFANQNLGWIRVGRFKGKVDGLKIYGFESIKYRPDIKLAQKYFESKRYYWNPGYWVVKPSFVLAQYRRFQPIMYKKLRILGESFGERQHKNILAKIYPTLEKTSFDNAILENLEAKYGEVIVADMGWSDVGTWQALKEALQKDRRENLLFGKTFVYKAENNLVYNYTPSLVATIGVEGLVVVATDDVILVSSEESMKTIKEVVELFSKKGKYAKYT